MHPEQMTHEERTSACLLLKSLEETLWLVLMNGPKKKKIVRHLKSCEENARYNMRLDDLTHLERARRFDPFAKMLDSMVTASKDERLKEMFLYARSIRESFVSRNFGFAKHLLRHDWWMTARVCDEDDLLQEAFIGMHEAIGTWRPSIGKFATWCGWCIKGRITAYLRRNHLVYVKQDPDPAKQKIKPRVLSLDSPLKANSKLTHLDLVVDHSRDDEEATVAVQDGSLAQQQIRKAVMELPILERTIVLKHFGMIDDDDQTLKDIGQNFKRSREWSRQLLVGAFAKLKNNLSSLHNELFGG